ncbi:MAG TPA: hypothetical protein VFI65_24440 [Streptosporangiaceae bacterium]|nr:hypothetical protein [Streptosporangiaceae bacterium]
MGYWGDFVLARSAGPLAELAPFVTKPGCSDGHTDCLHVCEERPGGWQTVQLCHYLPGDDYDWWLSELVAATGAPVMIATVADSAMGQLRGLAPSGAEWTTFLDPESADAEGMLDYLSDPDGDFEGEPEGAAVQRVLDAAPETADRIAGWAAEAGFQADVESVRQLLVQERDPFVEDLFFELITACGLPEIDSSSEE